MMLVNGKIPKGTVCPYREDCQGAKYSVCNGHGCPFQEEGAVHDREFSCAGSRLIEMLIPYEKAKKRREKNGV